MFDEKPTIVRGVIDLVFEESDGWVIVDYKTDPAEEKDLDRLAGKYEDQVREYWEAWMACTGESVKETGIYFVNPGRPGIYKRCIL